MKKTNGITIYENLKEIIDPSHSCLIVWDVQNGLADRIFNKEEFLNNLKVLLKWLGNKMPVVYTLITPPPVGFRASWHIYSMMRRFNVKEPEQLPSFMAPGSKEREIADA
nr:isochorismatase family protein [Nitrospiraceae bacterium]